MLLWTVAAFTLGAETEERLARRLPVRASRFRHASSESEARMPDVISSRHGIRSKRRTATMNHCDTCSKLLAVSRMRGKLIAVDAALADGKTSRISIRGKVPSQRAPAVLMPARACQTSLHVVWSSMKECSTEDLFLISSAPMSGVHKAMLGTAHRLRRWPTLASIENGTGGDKWRDRNGSPDEKMHAQCNINSQKDSKEEDHG